jgi:hypothetical protein
MAESKTNKFIMKKKHVLFVCCILLHGLAVIRVLSNPRRSKRRGLTPKSAYCLIWI